MNWIEPALVIIVHEVELRNRGGLPGLADRGALESALYRPQQLLDYQPETTLWQLAACYCEAIVAAHAFNDANKRTAFIIAATFLEDNGYRVDADQLGIVMTMTAVAEHGLTADQLANWFQRNSVKIETLAERPPLRSK